MPNVETKIESEEFRLDIEHIGERSLDMLVKQLLCLSSQKKLPLIPLDELSKHTTESIIQIDYSKEFKQRFFYSSAIAFQYGLIPQEAISHVVNCLDINLLGHDDQLKRIKFHYLSLNQSPELGEMPSVMSLTDSKDMTTHYLVRDPIATIINMMTIVIVANLSETDVEFRASNFTRTTTPELPPSFWSKTGSWQNISDNKLAYTEIYHPIMLETVQDLLTDKVSTSALLKNKTELTIMDVGGGNGQLAYFIISYLAMNNIKYKYILIEPDQSQCEQAKTLLNPLNIPASALEIHQSTLVDYIHQPGMSEKMNDQVDIILSSGGPINIHVVNKEDAWRNLMIMRLLLSENGRIIATGKSPLAYKAKELEKIGFTFFAKSTLVPSEDGIPFKQKYLMGCN
jgi:hypothetical protein